MHPRISELLAYVHEQTALLHSAFHAVPAERRGKRPAPDRWSPAEIVHHVTLADRRVAQRLEGIADQVRPLPPEDQVGPILPTIRIGPLLDRSRRLSAPDAIHPTNTDVAQVWADFEAGRRELEQVIIGCDGLALGAAAVPHPYFGNYTGYDWIAFAGAHAARHAAQIREMEY